MSATHRSGEEASAGALREPAAVTAIRSTSKSMVKGRLKSTTPCTPVCERRWMNWPSAVKCCPIFTATGMRTAARTRSTIERNDRSRTSDVRSRSAGRLKRFSSRASAPAFSTSAANGAHSCD